MSDEINEKVSVFLDGELGSSQLASLTDQVHKNPEIRRKLNRYVLISESMKGNTGLSNAESIADRVSQALEDEPTILSPVSHAKPASSSGWKTYFAGGAIAATVATLALLNFDAINQKQGSAESFPVTVQVQQPVNRPLMNGFAQPASTQWSISRRHTPESDVERELNQFLIEHSEYTHQSGMPGLVPYATFVVYDKK
jgi:sigma-E factor negative regulatory protein RseA